MAALGICDLLATTSEGRRTVLGALLEDLGGLEQHVVGDGEAEGLGGLEVDDELELAGLLDRKISRLGAFEDAV
jgi:hypothetical protein